MGINNLSEAQQKSFDKAYLINAGGVAGVFNWIVSIPQDIAATRIRLNTQKPIRNELFHEMRKVCRWNELAALRSIATLILVRGYIVNGVTLPLFDWCMGAL
jgi:hypothetical protein